MLASVSELVSWLAGRFRSRAKLELEVIALRHQLAVLHRQRPGRAQLLALDRLLWIWLYRVWPRYLNIMVLVKPATVVQWHRQGFRLYWRWRSRSGRPSIDREVRDLIRQMNRANPLWGPPRIHGELLKLGLEISQTTVAKYQVHGTTSRNTLTDLELPPNKGGKNILDRPIMGCYPLSHGIGKYTSRSGYLLSRLRKLPQVHGPASLAGWRG